MTRRLQTYKRSNRQHGSLAASQTVSTSPRSAPDGRERTKTGDVMSSPQVTTGDRIIDCAVMVVWVDAQKPAANERLRASVAIRRAACPIARGTPAPDLWSKGRSFEMTETLARPVVPTAEERARRKQGVHVERSSRRVRTYFGGKLSADSEHVLLTYETK